MKNRRRIILFLAAAAVITAAAALESFNLLAVRHRDQVREELQKVFGQDLTFDRLEVNLLGRPGFAAKDFRVADDARFAATPVVQARELVFGVSLWDLLWRRVVITSLTFHDPELQIISDEAGLLNLIALIDRKTELRRFPRLRPPATAKTAAERRPLPVSFAIREVRIKSGRIDYVDRSVKPAAELRIRNVKLNIRGFEPDEPTRIRIEASLTEGLGQDVRIDGRLTPSGPNQTWLQRSIDLNVRFDSLHVPVVARAIAALRDKIPRELDVTGPMALQVRLRGTPERPRLEDATLKIPLFGSSDYTAVVRGEVHFTERRAWEDAELKGTATVRPLPLVRLRGLRAFAQIAPELIADGNLALYSRFEGTWHNLRLGALVRAQGAELRYKNWFHKPADEPAAIRARIARVRHAWHFQDSELVLGNNRLTFTGVIDRGSTPHLQVRARNLSGSLRNWGRFFSAPALETQAGTVEADVTLARSLVAEESDWSVTGRLKLANAAFRLRTADRRIEKLDGEFVFRGQQAELRNASLRLGNSLLTLDGRANNLLEPRWLGTVRSAELHLNDLPGVAKSPPVRLKKADSAGEFDFGSDGWKLTAAVTSAEGDLNELPFRDLRANIVLLPSGLTFQNLQAETFSGQLRSAGTWDGSGETGTLDFFSRVEGLAVRALFAHLFPALRDRVQGRLEGYGRFHISPAANSNPRETVKASGETEIQQGVIKDFNILGQLLLKGSGTAVTAASAARLSAGLAALASRPDTVFDSVKADFTVEQRRVSSENLIFFTPDYTITASGWVGFDRSTEWHGSLVLSPRLTQEVQRDYRIIRYLLDRRGRLAISFRVDGKIPNLSVRLDNRALAQALRSGKTRSGDDAPEVREPGSGEKNWLPDALERLLQGG